VLGGAGLLALAGALWIIVASGRIEAVLAAAVVLLCLAQLFFVTMRDRSDRLRNADNAEFQWLRQEFTREVTSLRNRIERIEREPAEPAPRPQPVPRPAEPKTEREDILAQMNSIRQTIRSLSEQYGGPKPAPEPTFMPEPAPPPPSPRRTEAPARNEGVEFYLEPIVDLGTSATAHYRASLALTDSKGARLAHEDLFIDAERFGTRASLDATAATRAIPVVRRLAAKRPQLRVIVPLGRETPSAPQAMDLIEQRLAEASDCAGSILFEFDHAALAGLDARGIDGLERLSRQSGGLVLGSTRTAALDFIALRKMRVRMLSFDLAELAQRDSVARFASGQGFDVIVTSLVTADQISRAGMVAHYGRGRAFAPPRLVKHDLAADTRTRTAA
jgi:EAL domain-containing protein (putative c-di-GMP-specific phosphodiesterase class I)